MDIVELRPRLRRVRPHGARVASRPVAAPNSVPGLGRPATGQPRRSTHGVVVIDVMRLQGDQLVDRGMRRRLAVLRHVEEVTGNVAMTCRYFGISRQLYYTWLRRYQSEGP
jgi:hypothetical protein